MEFTNMIKLGALGFKPDDIRKIKDSGIKSDEIIELAKNGYTPKDVDELIKLANDEGGLQPENGADEKPPESNPASAGDETASDDKGTDPKDAEIEELKKKLEEDEKRIKDIQNKNASQNLGNAQPKSNRELVQEALRNLY
ncbi:MAG: hypothetical protein J6Q39_00445 [Bacteroidales bacterium]|nr:hypothetical protein [Bacteroidales bacterium]